MDRLQLEQSDVISFHNYDCRRGVREAHRLAEALQPPAALHRVHGPRQRKHVPGLAADREERKRRGLQLGLRRRQDADDLPWDSWKKPYTDREPTVWFHDIFRADGTPYRPEEVELIRKLTGKR